MPIRQTHTFVTLEVSQAVYREIAEKLLSAEYNHCFVTTDQGIVLDMHGLALKVKPSVCHACAGTGKRVLHTDPPQTAECKWCRGTGSEPGVNA